MFLTPRTPPAAPPARRDSLPPLFPRDLPTLVGVFRRVTTPDNVARAQAERDLELIERRPGYPSLLWNLLIQPSNDIDLRLYSAIMFKRSMIRYWRPTKAFCILGKTRDFLQQHILDIVPQFSRSTRFPGKERRVLDHVSLAVGEMLSNDHPRTWGSLISQIQSRVGSILGSLSSSSSVVPPPPPIGRGRGDGPSSSSSSGLSSNTNSSSSSSSSSLLLYGYLRLLNCVVERLCGKRYPPLLGAFQNLSYELLRCGFLFRAWNACMERVLGLLASAERASIGRVRGTFGSLDSSSKVIRKLLCFGMRESAFLARKELGCRQFFGSVLSRVIQLQGALARLPPNHPGREFVKRSTKNLVKLPLRVHAKHPDAFLSIAPGFVEFACRFVVEMPVAQLQMNYTLVRQLILLITNALRLSQRPLFPIPRFCALVKILITKYFLFSQSELRDWREYPERFFSIATNDDDDTSLRSCAESLYCAIVEMDSPEISQFTLRLIQELLDSTSASFDLQKLLLRDAAYAAFGWGNCFLGRVDFDWWYSNVLRQELLRVDPRYSIVRKRVMWVVGRWSEESSDRTQRDFYEMLATSLQKATDLVMRLSTIAGLEAVLSGRRFDSQMVQPFFDFFMQSILRLLPAVSGDETKLQLVRAMKLLIERMDTKSRKYARAVVESCQKLWEFSLRTRAEFLGTVVLQMVVRVVKLLGVEASANVHDFGARLIDSSLGIKQGYIFFGEEALKLWSSILKRCVAITPPLMRIYPLLRRFLDMDFNSVIRCLSITRMYVMIGRGHFLNVHGPCLVSILDILIPNVKPDCFCQILRLIDMVACLFPAKAPVFLDRQVRQVVHMALTGKLKPLSLGQTILLLSKFLVFQPATFFKFMQFPPEVPGGVPVNLVNRWFEMWIHHHDTLFAHFDRKLSVMALLGLFPTTNPFLLDRFSSVINLVVQVLYEGDETQLLLGVAPVVPDGGEGPGSKNVFDRDAAFLRQSLPNLVMRKLDEIRKKCGEQVFGKMMGSIDVAVRKQLDVALQQRPMGPMPGPNFARGGMMPMGRGGPGPIGGQMMSRGPSDHVM